MKYIVLSFAMAVQSWAQFQGLATTGDGSVLYFSSQLAEKNTTQATYGKIFRVDGNGLALQEQRTFVPAPSGGPFDTVLSSIFNLTSADVSSDGSVRSVFGYGTCSAPDALCGKIETGLATSITTPSGTTHYTATLRLSANGKWAFGGFQSFFSSAATVHLVDVEAGQMTDSSIEGTRPGIFISPTGRPVANDGTAVFVSGETSEVVVVPRKGSPRRFLVESVRWAAIDPAAQHVVASGPNDGNVSLINLATNEVKVLVPDGNNPVFTDDGQTIAYISGRSGTPQVWEISVDGSGDRQITADPLGIASAILSGDGAAVYAVTLGTRLIRVATVSGEVTEIVPRTPVLSSVAVYTAPGNLTTIWGNGLVDGRLDAGAPFPSLLGGLSVTVAGVPALVVSVQPNQVLFLTPPGTSAGTAIPIQLQQQQDTPSPFVSPFLLTANVQNYYPVSVSE